MLAAGCDGLRKTERIDCIFVRVFVVSLSSFDSGFESLIEGVVFCFLFKVTGDLCSLSSRARRSRTING